MAGFLVSDGGWKRPPGRAAEEEPAAVLARRTRLLQIPITVSLIGRWSTRKLRPGSCRKLTAHETIIFVC